MKTYYHVSMEHEQEIEEFIPRIPKHRIENENDTHERICVSTTIKGCIKAAPSIWYYMYQSQFMECFSPYDDMDKLTTLLDHDEQVGYLVKVYEFDLKEDEVIHSHILKKKGWVPDANKTDEHWITKQVKPNRSYYLLLQNPKEKNGEPLFETTKYEKHELGNTENYFITFRRQNGEEIIY